MESKLLKLTVVMMHDLRFAARTLRRSPGFAAIAVLSLALGIGANTAMFSLLDQVLLRSLPVNRPERLVILHAEGQNPGSASSDNRESVFSYPMYRDLRQRAEVFEDMVARAGAAVSVSSGGETDRAAAEIVSGNFFEALGVRSILGRLLTAGDDGAPGAHPVVVLSHGYWTRRFGASPAVLNETIRVNGHPMTVIGVAAPSFRGLVSGRVPDLYVPIAMKREVTPTWYGLEDPRFRWVNVMARLKDGVGIQQAQAALRALYAPMILEEYRDVPPDRQLATNVDLVPASQGIHVLRSMLRAPLLAMMGMVGFVLLIACANIANLLMVRAAGRQQEIAIRLSLGAGRVALVRQLLAESMLVALAGGLLGVLVAAWTLEAIPKLLSEGAQRVLSSSLDLRVLGFTALLTGATGLLFGLVPALKATRPDLVTPLKDQSAGSGTGTRHARLRRALVVGQIALSLVLLAGAGLFARTLQNLRSFDVGFRTENLLTFSVDPRLNGYTPDRTSAFYRDLQERLAALPGVHSVGGANLAALSGSSATSNVTVEGYRGIEDESRTSHLLVSPDHFQTMGIPLVAGREFTRRDVAGAPKVVVVNEAFARHFFGDDNPLGRRMAFGAGDVKLDLEIVGVVRNSAEISLREPVRPFTYLPVLQDENPGRFTFYVRTGGDEQALAPQVRAIVREFDANLPVFAMQSVRVQVAESMYQNERLIAILSSVFAVLATLLAVIGLYGVIAYTVARRTSEIGIRMAMGAGGRDVLGLVMKEVGLLAAAGIGIGLPFALALGRLVESLLFGMPAHEPAIFAAAACALALAAALAGYLPARRAARIEPVRALRHL